MSWGNNGNRGYNNGNNNSNGGGSYNRGGGNGYGGNNQQGGNQGTRQQDPPNKIRFSTVKLGQTKQGSPSIGVCLKREQMEKLATILGEMLNAGLDGCKFNMLVIEGQQYASGYMFVADKQQPQQGKGYGNNTQGQGKGTAYYSNGYNNGGNGNYANKQDARSYVQSKRLPDESQTQEAPQAAIPQGNPSQG